MLGAILASVTNGFHVDALCVLGLAPEGSPVYVAAYKRIMRVPVTAVVWLVTSIFCFFGFVHLRQLKPDRFIKLTRWMYDGQYVFDAAFAIPQVAEYKAKAQAYLFKKTLVYTVLFSSALLGLIFGIQGGIIYLVVVVLFLATPVYWVSAAYFLVLEVKEILGEDPWIYQRRQEASYLGKLFWSIVLVLLIPVTPFLTSYRKYYASFTNKLQVITYSLILGPFAALQVLRFGYSGNGDDIPDLIENIYLCTGAFITLSLWMLSLQYLEVNKTAGYLLPIVKDVMVDIWDFLIFYGVFQCGFTCAYYFIFQQKSASYKTLWASFRATYFVMYGENGAHLLPGPIMHFGFVLRMFHCAVMVVLLLNLLLAMMNKTVDRNWEKLQSRALASYARCVLRLEMMLGQTEADHELLGQVTTAVGSVRNPIFRQTVSKRDLTSPAGGELSALTMTDRVAELSRYSADLERQLLEASMQWQTQLDEQVAALQLLRK
ncbi:hypothetical protein ACHHYP_05625 [Achlya hypogyna]|uniref:Polycystin cation channel PKD1/PKD2 domain-containing protein n=1 Tax=Achlya hypogyna TaxID=1202772 RepID=A0A1V9YWY4_ACHHY|nr:hypothetical protein ACHHYP_05625 [Achlya hypogyna]